MSELKWYVLRVISGKEKKVKSYLEDEIKNINLTNYLSQVLVPSEKVYQTRRMRDGKTKKIAVEKVFFPGYIFMEADLSHGELLNTIKNISGVIRFPIPDPNDPNKFVQLMRESEINRILGKVENTDEYEIKDEMNYIMGEDIKIIDGPFNGFIGTVENIFEDKKKLNVMVKIFGRNTSVELYSTQVSKKE